MKTVRIVAPSRVLALAVGGSRFADDQSKPPPAARRSRQKPPAVTTTGTPRFVVVNIGFVMAALSCSRDRPNCASSRKHVADGFQVLHASRVWARGSSPRSIRSSS
jgi:hypothetical protein